MKEAGRPRNTPERLWSLVDKKGDDVCWPWKGYLGGGGYGRVQIGNKSYYAHRVIFDLANPNTITLSAPIDKREAGFLMHSCDNPVCCNPKHLKVSDQKENMQDRLNKGRYLFGKGPDHHRAVFTHEEQAEILRLRKEFGLTASQLANRFGKKLSTMKTLLARNREALNV